MTVIADATGWIKHFNKRMSTVNERLLFFRVHHRLHVLIVGRNLSKSAKNVQLSYNRRNLFEERIVGRGDFENFKNELVLLDPILVFQFVEMFDQIFETGAGKAHNSVFNLQNFVSFF